MQCTSQEKRYDCIFSCPKTRAVHLERTGNLSTDSFLQCLMRFVGRRAKSTDIYNDNGTNFVGALTEFRGDIKRWGQTKVSDRLLTLDIQFHFNPPAASRRGGVWEHIIRSGRRILLCLCGKVFDR
ncbi:hypothetical protein CLF_113237 [Clonorchis sinensis]|uniref:Integrase catalytic domain-containing protein n=1 Tax=Clonorchis sinensis TaxID=79923 RepID=G7YXY9_CLOSI|nr:hypothetical protein CLF_113237 [Clonorchis sinensis]